MSEFNPEEKKVTIDTLLPNGPMDRALNEANAELQNVYENALSPKVLSAGILTGNLTMQDGKIESGNFVTGVSGWRISSNGVIEATQIKVGSMFFTKQFVFSSMESTDGWVITGAPGVFRGIGGTSLQTSTTINTVRAISAEPYGSANIIDFSNKNPIFSCGLIFAHNTNQTIRFGMGTMVDGTPVNGVGFKIVGDVVSAMSNTAGTETLSTLSNVLVDEFHVYRAEVDSSTLTARYYIDDQLVATHTTNVPTGTEPAIMGFAIKNTEAANKMLIITFTSFQQDR